MSSNLYSKVTYHNGIDYYSGYIIEYDLSKANINALLSRGIISNELYQKLYQSDKQYREVYIGKMQRDDPNVHKEIAAGIIDAKRQFMEANNIKDEEILSIRNDAVYILSDRQMQQQFGHYYFAKKNVFTFFFKFFRNKELYYRFDQRLMKDIIEIKGIKDESLTIHQNYFLKFLADVCYNIQRSTIEDTLAICNEFYDNYINRRLDIEYYREFNTDSKFRISFSSLDKSYLFDVIDENNLNILDINYNLRIIRDLINVVDKIYFTRR